MLTKVGSSPSLSSGSLCSSNSSGSSCSSCNTSRIRAREHAREHHRTLFQSSAGAAQASYVGCFSHKRKGGEIQLPQRKGTKRADDTYSEATSQLSPPPLPAEEGGMAHHMQPQQQHGHNQQWQQQGHWQQEWFVRASYALACAQQQCQAWMLAHHSVNALQQQQQQGQPSRPPPMQDSVPCVPTRAGPCPPEQQRMTEQRLQPAFEACGAALHAAEQRTQPSTGGHPPRLQARAAPPAANPTPPPRGVSWQSVDDVPVRLECAKAIAQAVAQVVKAQGLQHVLGRALLLALVRSTEVALYSRAPSRAAYAAPATLHARVGAVLQQLVTEAATAHSTLAGGAGQQQAPEQRPSRVGPPARMQV